MEMQIYMLSFRYVFNIGKFLNLVILEERRCLICVSLLLAVPKRHLINAGILRAKIIFKQIELIFTKVKCCIFIVKLQYNVKELNITHL